MLGTYRFCKITEILRLKRITKLKRYNSIKLDWLGTYRFSKKTEILRYNSIKLDWTNKTRKVVKKCCSG